MSFMPRDFIVVDLFCGSGGSSEGAEQAFAELGLQIDLRCLNHWPIAIKSHSANHPSAIHYCQDISTARPIKAVPEGRLDLLMASPSCTHYSPARGGRPTSDQQRADPWHIITWLTELDVDRLIIENVWAFVKWGPVDPLTGRPIKGREGEYFRAWISVLRQLGYDPEWRKLDCKDYGSAQSRPRFILTAKKRRKTAFPDFPNGYAFAGNIADQIKQIGNAVPVRLMKALVKAMMADDARPMALEAAE